MLRRNFRKGEVLSKVGKNKFEIKDAYDDSIKISKLFGKQIANYDDIEIGMTVYIVKDYPLISDVWVLLTEKSLKGDSYLTSLKVEVDAFLEKNKKVEEKAEDKAEAKGDDKGEEKAEEKTEKKDD